METMINDAIEPYVSVNTQTFTDTQKAQARSNIGAGTSSFSGNYNDLTNKPTIPTVDQAVSNTSTNPVANKAITDYVDQAKEDIEGQIPTDYVAYTAQQLTDEQKLQARSNIGAGTSSFSGNYNDLTNKPTIPVVDQSLNALSTNAVANKPVAEAINLINTDLDAIEAGAVRADISQSWNAQQQAQARTNIGAGTGNSNFSGDYNDLTNKPTIPTEVVRYVTQTLTEDQKNQARTNIGAGTSSFSGAYDDLTGAPSDLLTYSEQALTSEQQAQVRTNIGAGTSSFSGSYTDLTNKPDIPANVVQYVAQSLNASEKQQARTNIGAGTSNFSGSYNDLTNKPAIPTNVVQYTTQTLTTEQQAQARANIGAGTGSSDFSGNYNDLTNKPDIPTKTSDLTNDSTFQTSAQLAEATNGAVVNVAFNEANGVFTFTRKDGSTFTLDTNLKKLAVNFTYDAATKSLIIHYADGTTENIPLEDLITEYTGSTGTDVDITITTGTDSSIIGAILKQTGTLASYAKKTDLPTNYVAYTAQTLSDAQKQQARTNIGAGTGTSNFSGNYNDLTNKPVIPTNVVLYTSQSLEEAQKQQARTNIGAGTSSFSGSYNDLTDKPSIVQNVVQYVAQSLSASQQAQARTNIGAGTSNFSGSYNDLINKPVIPTDYLKYTQQTLSTAQQQQARANIGAGTSNFDGKYTSLTDTPEGHMNYLSDWSATVTYNKNDAVNYYGRLLLSKVDGNLNHTPNTDVVSDDYWQNFNFYSIQNQSGVTTSKVYLTGSVSEANNSLDKQWKNANVYMESGVLYDSRGAVMPASENGIVKYTAQSKTDNEKQIARNNIGAGTSNFSGNYSDLANVPAMPVYRDAWSDTYVYEPNDLVRYDGFIFFAVAGGQGNKPDITKDTDYWRRLNYGATGVTNTTTTAAYWLLGTTTAVTSPSATAGLYKRSTVYVDTSGYLRDARGLVAANSSLSDVLRYSAQTLTAEQQAQVKTNLGITDGGGAWDDITGKPEGLLNYKGTYVIGGTYDKNDVVKYTSFYYISLVDNNTNDIPAVGFSNSY